AARALFEEALAINREIGNPGEEAFNLMGLGVLSQREGDPATARQLYRRTLVIRHALGETRMTARALECLAGLLAEEGRHALAARLWAAAAAARTGVGAPLPPNEREAYECSLALTRTALGATALAAAWAEGSAVPLEQAVATAL